MKSWAEAMRDLDEGRVPIQGCDGRCSARNHSYSTIAPDVATLQAKIDTLQAELKATNTAMAFLAASVGRLEAEQAPTTPSTTTTTHTTPIPPSSCPHASHPRTIASGRGAASPEVFQQIIKTNWHGRLGRTHMVDVDALPGAALTELDCLLRRRLHAIYPRDRDKVPYNTDQIFASLAALGLRLEDRGRYADVTLVHDSSRLNKSPTIRRASQTAAWFQTHEKYGDYWEGSVMETMVELARYRGLFDDEGYLRE